MAIFCQELKSAENSNASTDQSHAKDVTATDDKHVTLLSEGVVPQATLKRIMKSLTTGVEFSSSERSYKATQTIETAIKGLCDGLKSGTSGAQGKDEVVDDEGSHPAKALSDLYSVHVYGSVSLANPPLIPKPADAQGSGNTAAPVNVLTVKRKKKKE